ncbi:MAG: DUF4038 domain-containing protein [Gammaproteobacteria bacterium]|nr:DUF4038 domain-containing protein [Gammaproteobacteria bacterium]
MLSSRVHAFGWLFALLLLPNLASAAETAETAARLWRVTELEFASSQDSERPMDVELTAQFTGPDGSRLDVPGYWDGENAWKIRFTPTRPGKWTYVTRCSRIDDSGLHDQHGMLLALPADGDNPLFKHGGFLKVSKNKHYLTYSDGTPFFWLGDTWWFCPSKLCPIEGSSNPKKYPSMFKALVDTRKSQGFTVAQMAFLGPTNAPVPHLNPRQWTPANIDFWRGADEYISYANEAGIVPVIGVGFHRDLDKPSLEDLKLLWRYMVARYGAFAVTWLIMGEYSMGADAARIKKVMALGQFIKDIDPYKRAMSIHPENTGAEHRVAWNQPWYDFIMNQCGHPEDRVPSIDIYLYPHAFGLKGTKPVLEAECNYEGIRGKTADRVRLVAYRAIQSGSFGYTYGAHGLWYPTQFIVDKTFWMFGVSPPWWEALKKPGAEQMGYLRQAYESVNWWELEARPQAVTTALPLPEGQRILTKASGDKVFLIYFPKGLDPMTETLLQGTDRRGAYSAEWFNPRNGDRQTADPGNVDGRLPPRPDDEDWMLILRKQ